MSTIFFSRLKQARGTQSQSEVCRAIGVKQGTYSTWELGKCEPPLSKLVDVAKYFGVSTEWLLGIETIGDRIRAEREARGWTISEFTRKMAADPTWNMKEDYWAGIENGTKKPTDGAIRAVANVFGLKPEHLTGVEPIPKKREVSSSDHCPNCDRLIAVIESQSRTIEAQTRAIEKLSQSKELK